MAAGQHDAQLAEGIDRAGKQLVKLGFLDRPAGIRQRGDGERGERAGVHRVQIANGVERRDPPKPVGIVDKGLEVINRLYLDQTLRIGAEQLGPNAMHRRILARRDAHEDARVIGNVEALEHRRKHVAGNLRAAAAAAHRGGFGVGRRRRSHRREVRELRDPGPVDAILELAPACLPAQRAIAQDGVTVRRVQEAQAIALGMKRAAAVRAGRR